METVPVSKFKAMALSYVDRASKGEEIIVTKRGRTMAKLVPAEAPRSLLGSVEYIALEEELLAPIPTRWDAGE